MAQSTSTRLHADISDDLDMALELFKCNEFLAVDTETNGQDIRDGRGYAIGISLAGMYRGVLMYGYFPIRHAFGSNISHDSVEALREAFANYTGTLVFHNAKFDLRSLATCGIQWRGDFYCTLLMAHLVNENLPYAKDLSSCVRKYVSKDISKKDDPAFKASVKAFGWDMPVEFMIKYASWDAAITYWLFEKLYPFFSREVSPAYWEHKKKFIRVIMAMEDKGIGVDTETSKKMVAVGEYTMDDVVQELGGLNPGSPKDLKTLLIDMLNLPVIKASAKTGKPSFDKEVMKRYEEILEEKQSPVATQILTYRGWQKTVSSNYKAYLELLSPDGLLRPNYKLHGTVTGRMSCVSEDTLIEMPRDLQKYPDGVPITEVREGDWVYCFDWQRKLELKKVKWVGKTGHRLTYTVTLENSEGHRKSLRLTAEHLVRLYHGDWRPAGSLMHKAGQPKRDAGPRVMNMVKRHYHGEGYVSFFPNSVATGNGQVGGGKNKEHRWVLSKVLNKNISTKNDVHHKDGNKANNHPSNLQEIPAVLHRGHAPIGDGIQISNKLDMFYQPVDYRVISVKPYKYETVWDMEVEDVHNFIANGVCVHNCEKPNLQQIPKESDKPWNGNLKSIFRPTRPGYTLWEADYAQLELRLAAAYGKEDKLIQAFEEGRDIFNEMSDTLGMVRQDCKTLTYTIQYGGGIKRLMEVFRVGAREAGELRDNFFNEYLGIKTASNLTKSVCINKGKVPLWSGRYRHFRFPREESHKAFNSVMQGGAADIMEHTMVRFAEQIEDENCAMLLQVHDSIVFELKDGCEDEYFPRVIEVMTNVEPAGLGVKFAVDIHRLAA